MKNFIREIFRFLSFKEKIYFLLLQVLVVISAILESTSVFSVGFFFSSLMINEFQLPKFINVFFNIENLNKSQQIEFLGILTLISFSSTLVVSFLNNLSLIAFSENLSRKLKNNFFSFYLDQDLSYHKNNSSNKLIKNLIIDLDRVSAGLVLPFLKINSKLTILVLILISLFILKPMITISLVLVFFTIYFLIIFSLRKFLAFFGKLISIVNEERVRIIQESILSIKDVLLSKSKFYFLNPFENLNNKYFKFSLFYSASSVVPRTLIDLIAFSSLIIAILIITSKGVNSFDSLMNTLIILGFGAYRILPIFQDIYNATLQIKGSRYVLEIISKDLISINHSKKKYSTISDNIIQNSINIKNINFKYKKNNDFTLKVKNIDLKIGKSIAIIGRSGSGKSTLIELLLGLIYSKHNQIFYDNNKLNKKFFESNRFNISYVSQKPYILNDNIISNILMINSKEIDQQKLTNDKFLHEIIKNLNLNFLYNSRGKINIDKKFGEDGNMISGGQKQRVAIARAIYKRQQILVLDEATSSLDKVTESRILKFINSLDFIKSFIYVTHKVHSTKKFDQILYIDNGNLVDQGNYNYLYKKYVNFRKLIEINKN